MGKFSGYLLCTDFDGTFASSNLSFHQDNIDLTSYFIENGGHFTLATGRTIDSAFPYISNFRMSAPSILFNGGIIYDFNSGNIIYKKSLDPIWKDYVKFIFKKFPNIIVQTFLEKSSYIFGNRKNLSIIDEIEPNGNNIIVKDIDQLPDNSIKVMFIGEAKMLLEIESFVKNYDFSTVIFVKSADFLLEVIPAAVSKGNALEVLANHLNIKMENTFAIGDYYNDITMLKKAGFSAAVDNAPDDVKKSADIIVGDHNEGAVAEFVKIIEKRILG